MVNQRISSLLWLGGLLAVVLSVVGCKDSSLPWDQKSKAPTSKKSQTSGNSAPREVLATMGTVTLTVDEFNKFLKYMVDAGTRKLILGNSQQLTSTIRQELVNKFIIEQAVKENWDERDKAKFLMERAENKVLIDYYVASASQPKNSYPHEELVQKAYYDNLAKFQNPARVHLAQIYLTMGKDVKKVRKKAKELAVKAKKKEGADFELLASKHSEHQLSAKKGGDLGWISFPNLLPAFKKALVGMEPGQIKGPVESEHGLHIIQLVEWQKASYQPYKKVKDTLISALQREKSKKNQLMYLKGLIQENPITIKELRKRPMYNLR